MVDIVADPCVSVERYDEMIVLLTRRRVLNADAVRPPNGQCDVIVVPRGRLPHEEDTDRESVPADLVNSGLARFPR